MEHSYTALVCLHICLCTCPCQSQTAIAITIVIDRRVWIRVRDEGEEPAELHHHDAANLPDHEPRGVLDV